MNSHDLCKIQAWYQQPTGLWVLEQERAMLKPVWSQCLGHYLLQLGLSPKISELSAATALRSTVTLTPSATSASSVVGDFTLLPIATESIGAVLVHHWLGMYADPKLALEEIYRVLAPEGQVIICGMRPSWLWQIYDQMRQSTQFPWSRRSASVWQVKIWLAEVGFTVGSVWQHSHGLSLYRYAKHLAIPQKLDVNLPFGSGYILMAQKRVTCLTPLKLEWAMRSQLANYREGDVGSRVSR